MRPIKQQTRKESVDERKTSAEWRKLGHLELKIMVCNHNGWPDRWYAAPKLGVPSFWCEWKAIGREPEPHQVLRHRELREQGECVIVAHSREEFWEQVRQMQTLAKL